MKVLIEVDKFQGGAGNIAQILADNLSHRGYSVTLALTNDPQKLSERRYSLQNVDLVYMSSVNDSRRFKLFLTLLKNQLKLLRSVKPDIVISFLTNTNILATIAAKHLAIPIIVSERSNPIAIKEKFPWSFLQRITYKRADIIAVQFDCFKGFLPNIKCESFRCLPNVVLENKQPKKDYLNPLGTFNIVAVGNLRQIKNYFGMLEIVKEAQRRGMNVKLDIYGTGPQEKEIESQIASMHLENLVFLKGHVLNIHDILPQYDCYFMTSFQEGFPNGLSEAMASGLPCITYKCHDGFEELIKDSHNGFLVPFGDVQKFVDNLEHLYEDCCLRAEIGNRAKQISKKYSIDKVVDMWVVSIKEVLSRYEQNKRY